MWAQYCQAVPQGTGAGRRRAFTSCSTSCLERKQSKLGVLSPPEHIPGISAMSGFMTHPLPCSQLFQSQLLSQDHTLPAPKIQTRLHPDWASKVQQCSSKEQNGPSRKVSAPRTWSLFTWFNLIKGQRRWACHTLCSTWPHYLVAPPGPWGCRRIGWIFQQGLFAVILPWT